MSSDCVFWQSFKDGHKISGRNIGIVNDEKKDLLELGLKESWRQLSSRKCGVEETVERRWSWNIFPPGMYWKDGGRVCNQDSTKIISSQSGRQRRGNFKQRHWEANCKKPRWPFKPKWLGWEIGWNRYFWYVIWLYRMIFSRLMSILLIHISKTWFKAKRTAWGFILPESASRKQIRQNQMKTVAVEIS